MVGVIILVTLLEQRRGSVVFNPTPEHIFSSYPHASFQCAAPLVSIRQGDHSVCSRLLDLLHLEDLSRSVFRRWIHAACHILPHYSREHVD